MDGGGKTSAAKKRAVDTSRSVRLSGGSLKVCFHGNRGMGGCCSLTYW